MTTDEFFDELTKHKEYKFETIRCVEFYNINIDYIKFIYGTFVGCTFDTVYGITGGSFYNSIFDECKFENTTIINCNFRKCDLQKTYFKNCKFINCNFIDANLYASKMINCVFENCNFNYANLYYIRRWGSTYFEKCNLNDVKTENLEQLPIKY